MIVNIMAIRQNRVSKLIEPSLRIKQRDYTIPVRLNQLPLSNVNLSDVCREQFDHQFKVSKMINPISIKAKIFLPSFLMVVAIATLTINTEVCQCDTLMGLRSSSSKNELIDIPNASNEEHSLSSLSSDIERQHFKLSPVRAFVHQQRPSKFDSGDDWSEEFSGTNYINKNSIPKNGKHLANSIKHVDESMRHILKMHETVNPIQPVGSKSLTANRELGNLSSRWRDISSSSTRVVSTLINPNKIVSHVLSYISPIGIFNKIEQKSAIKNSTSTSLHKFVARTNNHAPITSMSFKQKNQSPRLSATASPKDPYITRPDLDKSDARQYAIYPTTFDDKFGNVMLKTGFTKHKYSPEDLIADSSSISPVIGPSPNSSLKTVFAESKKLNDKAKNLRLSSADSWLKNNANHMTNQNYIQDSFKGLFTLSQLPILFDGSKSTAPSIFENGNKQRSTNKTRVTTQAQNQGTHNALDQLYRYAYIIGTSVGRKKDPLVALVSFPNSVSLMNQHPIKKPMALDHNQLLNRMLRLRSVLSTNAFRKAKSRGVMWDMATDPSLAVTVFHLLERASVALPLGFLLMPFVQMIRNPLNGFNLGRILPAKASHRSIDYEELAKRLDVVDKMLSRALRPTHRESLMGK